jgi:glycosyltransferase involved in cell wall biosynthesis
MAHVESPSVRGVLAGTGPLRAELEATASRLGVVDRIDLCGFLPDDQAIEHYSRALAVLYAPFDEDYGYVTLQAFLAGKPVITAKDSGGVLEWVDDGVTGIVTDGSPAAIGAAIDRLAGDRDLARQMGEAGRARLAHLSWGPVVDRLLGTP